ncbi:hypothetical protein Tco_1493918 [Tanacetum coccineum]
MEYSFVTLLEHHDYDVLGFLTIEGNVNDTPFESSDEYESSDDVEEIDYVDFHTKGEENVVIKNLRTQDPFLNKLYSNHGSFNGFIDEPQPVDQELIDDPDAASIERLLRFKKRNVEAGRCAGMYSNKKYVAKRKLFADDSPRSEKKSNTPKKSQTGKKAKPKKKQGTPVKQGRPVKKAVPVKKSVSFSPTIKKSSLNSGEGSSRDAGKSPQSPKWTKSKIICDKKQGPVCGFRLWASWMTTEQSFQIKSLHPEHKCSRNYKLGSLVTYKWIAHQFAKEIINDPFMPYIKLKDAIRQKFMIDVSIGQCKRAKQRALYDHEGGLIEHYGRLWDYRQALLESNPGSTCRLDVEETGCGKSYFKRFYICFKGMKDGWLEGCRRVIGLDGCFLKHTCRGELLTAMGRDANNQMYPIAWAVGLHDAVRDWLPNSEHMKCTRHIYANFKKKFSDISGGDSAFGVNLGIRVEGVVSKVFIHKSWSDIFKILLNSVSDKLWKRTDNHPPLPPIVRKMHGRPRKE